MPIVKLTEALVRSLTCPPGKARVEFCDSEMPGLYIDVRASNAGTGVYYFRYKDKNGKTCHQKLGRVCDLDLAEAREAGQDTEGGHNRQWCRPACRSQGAKGSSEICRIHGTALSSSCPKDQEIERR